MPAFADAPVRRLASSGSTNALFRLGEELLVRLPRQPGGSTTISKEATWLPVLAPLLPVSVPDVVAVFEADRNYPERWSVVRWIDGAHPGWSIRTPPSTHDVKAWPRTWPQSWTP
jgi:aminoglycoside phosphotransferase (APT) family kinase protein